MSSFYFSGQGVFVTENNILQNLSYSVQLDAFRSVGVPGCLWLKIEVNLTSVICQSRNIQGFVRVG